MGILKTTHNEILIGQKQTGNFGIDIENYTGLSNYFFLVNKCDCISIDLRFNKMSVNRFVFVCHKYQSKSMPNGTNHPRAYTMNCHVFVCLFVIMYN